MATGVDVGTKRSTLSGIDSMEYEMKKAKFEEEFDFSCDEGGEEEEEELEDEEEEDGEEGSLGSYSPTVHAGGSDCEGERDAAEEPPRVTPTLGESTGNTRTRSTTSSVSSMASIGLPFSGKDDEKKVNRSFDLSPSLSVSSKSEVSPGQDSQPGTTAPLLSSLAAYYGMPLPMYAGPMPHFPITASSLASPDGALNMQYPHSAMYSSALPSPCDLSTAASPGTNSKGRGMSTSSERQSQAHSEYKRSERGLSFLFPSLSDHNLSLLDKVKITVMRHKNNYFLGWSEEDLRKIDPLIRPKMIVSPEIYKEYCHRNAMKYDSNLQFAMESNEAWAQEFRTKLLRPPSEGGFSSLCEVKLEAGRLWREFSGKYRMHNIVKWQMDLNQASKGSKNDLLDCGGSQNVPVAKLEQSRDSVSSCSPHSPLVSNPGQDTKPPAALVSSKAQDPSSLLYLNHLPAMCNMTDALHGFPFYPGAKGMLPPAMFLPPASAMKGLPANPFSQNSQALDLHVDKVLNKTDRPGPDHSVLDRSSRDSPASTAKSKTPKSIRASRDSIESDTKNESSTLSGLSVSEAEVTPGENLFKPLPRSLSVTEQMYIWLERHRHNYFLNYSLEDLASLSEYLRPSRPVTHEVFKRFVPESMIDILSKIEHLMGSSDTYAKEFQERVHKSAKDGGFATFEDALTEAVVVWLKKGKSCPASQGKAEVPAKNQAGQAEMEIEEAGETERRKDLSGAVPSHNPQYTHTTLCTAPEENKHNPSGSVKAVDTAPRNPTPEGSQNTESSQTGSPGGPAAEIWGLREELQKLCVDDPEHSWQHRLQPYLPILRNNLGDAYLLPNKTSDCIVDLVLAAVDSHVSQHNRDKSGICVINPGH